jgi:NAD+ kinase
MPSSSTPRNTRSDRLQLPQSRRLRVLILGDRAKPDVPELAVTLEAFLAKHARVLGVDLKRSSEPIKDKPDLVVVLGGDGAMLAASRRLGKRRVPVMGINFGTVGFLAAVSRERASAVLVRALDGKAWLEDRAMMHATVKRDGQVLIDAHILNEVVIGRQAGNNLIDCDLLVDRRPVCTYRGDGVIISTPTGSTAYNLAAHGPILSPRLDAWVVTPIAPHMLGMRPLVLPGHRTAYLRVHQRSMFTADGHEECSLRPGDVIRVAPSARRFQLVVDREQLFYARLRKKLHWGAPPAS